MAGSPAELVFPFLSSKPIIARFDGGDITSDAGLLLLAQADRKLGLTEALSNNILDVRDPAKIVHPVVDLIRERVFAIALGYEDANDLDSLADDPALRAACGRRLVPQDRLASQPTISRLENRADSKDLLCMALALAKIVVGQLPRGTRRVILDVDASEDPCHGQQEFEFFNSHYNAHCYLPVFVHITAEDGRQRLMTALLRPGNADAKTGLFGILRRCVQLIRKRFPKTEIVLRGDCAYGQAEVIAFCREHGLPFVLGLSTNARVKRLAAPGEQAALSRAGIKDETARFYASFHYKADSWAQPERVIERIEITAGAINPRFVVSNLADETAEAIYLFYCERGEQENRIKEIKLDLRSDRTSCHRFLANQFRLLLHAAASVLFCALQDALSGTSFAKAQVGTIRLKLLKAGAQAIESTRRLWFRLSSSFAYQSVWHALYARLSCT